MLGLDPTGGRSNGKTEDVFSRTDHPEVARSRSAAWTYPMRGTGGKSAKEVCRVLEISEQTYYRWRIPYSGHLGVRGTERHTGQEAKNARKRKYPLEGISGRPVAGQRHPPVGTSGRCKGGALKKVISPDRCRKCWTCRKDELPVP